MYGIDRADLEWILDAAAPSASFPALKRNELNKYGEYRTQRYVLQAFDHLESGEIACRCASYHDMIPLTI